MPPPDLSTVPTSALVERLTTCGFDIPAGLPEEIARRGREAIEPLSALARDAVLWDAPDPPRYVAPIHAVHLLGAIGDAACAPALVEAVTTRDMGDFLTDGAPSILAALDPAAIPLLAEAALDTTLDTYQRDTLAKGLYGIGARHPAHRAEVADLFTRFLRDDDDDLVSLLVDEAARIDDPAVQASVDAALDEGRVDPFFIGRSDVESLRAKPWSLSRDFEDPMAYFRSGILAQMKRNAAEAARARPAPSPPRAPGSPKIGRNDPCPCGSGKKYKKCCLR